MVFDKQLELRKNNTLKIASERLRDLLEQIQIQVTKTGSGASDGHRGGLFYAQADFFYSDPATRITIAAQGKQLILRNFTVSELSVLFSHIQKEFLHENTLQIPIFLGVNGFDDASHDKYWKHLPYSEWFIPSKMQIATGDSLYDITIKLPQQEVCSDADTTHLQTGFERTTEIENLHQAEDADAEEWKLKVEYIKENILSGGVTKVVLARRVSGNLPQEITASDAFLEMITENPTDTAFYIRNGNYVFMGVTPEKLLSVKNEELYTEAIAGSIKRNGVYNEEEMVQVLSSSEKDLDEHLQVRDFLLENLQPYSQNIVFENLPTVKKLRNLFHLKTTIEGKINHPGLSTSLELVQKIFPTPAVCGYPKAEAFQIIQQIETAPRGYYSGIIGYFNLEGDCEFAVTIRSVLLTGSTYVAYAGCGIVKNSNPDLEFEESKVKLKTATAHFHYANQP